MSKRSFKVMMAQSPVDAREFIRNVIRENDAPKNTRYYLLVDSYFGRYPQINIRRYGCNTYFAVCYGKVVRAFCRTNISGRIGVDWWNIRLNGQAELEELVNVSREVSREEFLKQMNEK